MPVAVAFIVGVKELALPPVGVNASAMRTLSSVTLPVFLAVIVYVITSPAETGLLNALVSAVFVTSIAAEGVSSSVIVPVPATPPIVSVYVSVASGVVSLAPATVTVKLETPDGTVSVLPERVTPFEKLIAP